MDRDPARLFQPKELKLAKHRADLEQCRRRAPCVGVLGDEHGLAFDQEEQLVVVLPFPEDKVARADGIAYCTRAVVVHMYQQASMSTPTAMAVRR